MAEAKKSYAIGKLITPKCVLVFPYLNKPDTKFNADGEYRTKARFAVEDAPTIIEKLQGFYDEAIVRMVEEQKGKAKTPALAAKITDKTIKRAADLPWKLVTNDETGEETGEVMVSFKQKAQITGKDGTVYKKKVDLFDAARKPFPADKPIYGGTVAKVAFEALPFYTPALGAGLTLRLNAVQIITLRTAGARDAAEYGFGEEGEGMPEEMSDETATGGDAPAGGESNPDF